MESVTTKRILIVEDERNLRTLVQISLEVLAGWKVIVAASGEEGLLLAERERPDAIILDVMMPGMDGITFLQELLANPDLQNIPVVFLTAKAELIEPECFAKLGATGAIAKPFEPLTLHKQVASFLGWDCE
ncbi:response regulator [Phormidium sp. LEGE 05292]|uniref:response regulator n=1 Tax=[Phormidium] sp. LEGE 05292 TaxID=767427 RepID=UPI001881C427|nr:response regulator [Phormidium sp. LEGE 05292]MBE9229301.1 response regulator [Phormidium sp. LEGE 05292]